MMSFLSMKCLVESSLTTSSEGELLDFNTVSKAVFCCSVNSLKLRTVFFCGTLVFFSLFLSLLSFSLFLPSSLTLLRNHSFTSALDFPTLCPISDILSKSGNMQPWKCSSRVFLAFSSVTGFSLASSFSFFSVLKLHQFSKPVFIECKNIQYMILRYLWI